MRNRFLSSMIIMVLVGLLGCNAGQHVGGSCHYETLEDEGVVLSVSETTIVIDGVLDRYEIPRTWLSSFPLVDSGQRYRIVAEVIVSGACTPFQLKKFEAIES